MVIALAGSLGVLGIARGLLLPGTIPAVVPLNPVGGVMGALMLLCTPAAMGIWLGRSRAWAAAAAGALGGGAVWLCAGPLLFVPGMSADLLHTLATAAPNTAGAPPPEALAASLRMLALGLPTAMVVSAALTWSGAEFSARTGTPPLRADPVARALASGIGLSLVATLAAYSALGTPNLPAALAPVPSTFPDRGSDVLLSVGVLFTLPTLLFAVAGLRALRKLRAHGQEAGPRQGLVSPLAAGAWAFVAMLWAGGLPTSLSSTFGAGILPLCALPVGNSAPAIDPSVWDAMYDHTMVGLVVCLLTGLVVTTVAGLLVPVELPEEEVSRSLDWFR